MCLCFRLILTRKNFLNDIDNQYQIKSFIDHVTKKYVNIWASQKNYKTNRTLKYHFNNYINTIT